MFQPDVIVVGGGLIGLACATAVAREGARVLVVAAMERGTASGVSAGILAPSVGDAPASARELGFAARDLYPEYVAGLASRTGRLVPLDRSGVLEVALDESAAIALRAQMRGDSTWVDATSLADLEPSLGPAVGAAFHPFDGAVDAAELLDVVTADAERDPRLSFLMGRVTRLDAGHAPALAELDTGARVEADTIILAAGAWASGVQGLPHPLPVVPVRGQISAFDAPGPRRVIIGSRGYLVRRGNLSLVGSTMEYVGYDANPTEDGAAQIRQIARQLSPSLGASALVAHRAGLRPVTPDFLPIVGRDADSEGLLYACGHSRNGVLLAPLTARVIADLVARGSSTIDVAPYAADRFGATGR